jgi:hypothetical protein
MSVRKEALVDGARHDICFNWSVVLEKIQSGLFSIFTIMMTVENRRLDLKPGSMSGFGIFRRLRSPKVYHDAVFRIQKCNRDSDRKGGGT